MIRKHLLVMTLVMLKLMELNWRMVFILLLHLLLLHYVITLMHLVIQCFVGICVLLTMILCHIFCILLLLTFAGIWYWDGVEDDSNSRRGGWWGHRHAGHARTGLISKLQVDSNSVFTFISDSANTPARFRRYLPHTESEWGDLGCVGIVTTRRFFLVLVPAPEASWIILCDHKKDQALYRVEP